MSKVTQVQIFLLVLALGFLTGPRVLLALSKIGIGSDIGSSPNASQVVAVADSDIKLSVVKPVIVAIKSPYDQLTLEAKSVYVWDISAHKKLYGKNEEKQLPLASVTKMMMALVAVELLPSDTKVTINSIDLESEGDNGLFLGEKWVLADLLKFTLISSSNDGASAIASVAGASLLHEASSSDPFLNKQLFVQRMNEKAEAIGLTNTHFSNESGLDLDSVTSGAYGSTRDMAMLFQYIFKKHSELFTPTTYKKIDLTSLSKVTHHVANTNEGVARVTGLIGSKTGYTDLAGGNLVVVVDIGVDHPVVIAVLGSSREGRFTDIAQLISATVNEITQVDKLPDMNAQPR